MVVGLEKYIVGVFERIEHQEPSDNAIKILRRFVKILRRNFRARAQKHQGTRRNYFIQAAAVLKNIRRDLRMARNSTKTDDKLMYQAWARIRIYDLRTILRCLPYTVEGYLKYLATSGKDKNPVTIERDDAVEVEPVPYNNTIPPNLKVRM